MFGWIRRDSAKEQIEVAEAKPRNSLFSTHRQARAEWSSNLMDVWRNYLLAHAPRVVGPDGTFDDNDSQGSNAIKQAYMFGQPNMSDELFQWFGTQSYIGPQACAILSQHWMISKICHVPARDAIRQGFEIINDVGEKKLDSDVIAEYAKYDKLFGLTKQLMRFGTKGRRFGIRLAIPVINSPDPEFYEKPYNPDSIRPGAFKGWLQVDPYWTSPILDGDSASKPDTQFFYEPTWWQINGKKYHRSHICIFRTDEPDDLLKPSYLYAGVPIPQKIMERVYAAERTGNEAPLLVMTKRLQTFKASDVEAIMLNKDKFDESMSFLMNARDNYGVQLMGSDDDFQQFDTSLADLWTTIEGEYGLACAAGGVPVNKIMGTAAGGLSNEGAYDESSYHEELESSQTHDYQPMVERHHELVKHSFIIPKFGKKGNARTTISWMPLDSPTAKEYAEINELNSRSDLSLVQTGAIESSDINERLRNDKNSGYSTIRPIEEGEREPINGGIKDDDLALGTPGKVTVSETKGDDNGASAS